MKRKIVIVLGLGILAGTLISACGDNNGPMPVAQTPVPQALDTAQVLALALKSSETNQPFVIDGGALTFTDTSETSEPISINLM
jgi:hypothetical protein